jgi:phosphoribosylanthranilate isomerase
MKKKRGVKVKVCGLVREQDVKLACDLGAWAVGFVLAEGSPRRVTIEEARRLRALVTPGVLAVGVFQDAMSAEIEAAAGTCGFDVVQVHGVWPSFMDEFTIPVWRGLGLSRGAPPHAVSPRVSAVLVEPARTMADRRAGRTPTPEQQAWVWAQAKELRREGLTVIAAGGLNAGNVAAAIAASGADAVDVSGGVESSPGAKDAGKLKAFFAAAR